MSRTDKDMPGFVTALWWEPDHLLCEFDHLGARYRRGPRRECDLPPRPVRMPLPPGVRRLRCTWWPDVERRSYGPRPGERRVYWHGPQRRLSRDQCRHAVQQYNGSREVEIEVDTSQHRHSISWWW